MHAWYVNDDGSRVFRSMPEIAPAPGGVCVKMQAAPVLSYMRQVLDGLLGYALPPKPFVPGTNGIGIVAATGAGGTPHRTQQICRFLWRLRQSGIGRG